MYPDASRPSRLRTTSCPMMDDSHYLDVSDVVDDFDEAFFGSNGLTRLAECRSGAERNRTATGVRRGSGSERRSHAHTRFSASA